MTLLRRLSRGQIFRFGKLKNLNKVQIRTMADNGAKKPKIEVAPNTIGTHSGTFHCDEILAVYLLSKHPEFSSHKLLRTRDQALLDQCDIVVDVGSVFDPSKKRYDHHQKTFHETFSSLRPEFAKGGNIR
jgi:hypothetical protein